MAYPQYMDYKVSIARGQADATLTSIHAYCNTMSATTGIVLSPKNLYNMTTPAANTANAQYMRLTSSQAADATAGTGMVQCYLEGIDEDGASLAEAVLMSGQTPKTTTNKYVTVNRIWAYTCGSGGINAGDIYITGNADSTTAGVPDGTSTSYAVMAAGDGKSSDARYFVPASYTAYVYNVVTGQNHSTDNTIMRGYIKEPNKPKQLLAEAVGDKSFQFDVPIKIPEKSYFWIDAYADASATSADAIVQLVLHTGD